MHVDEAFRDSLQDEETRDRMLMTLRIVPLFVKFTVPEAEEVLRLAKKVRFEPMEVLFEQGGDDRKLHIVLEGSVLLYQRAPGGGETIVGQKTLDTCFGEIAFITGQKRNTGMGSKPVGLDWVPPLIGLAAGAAAGGGAGSALSAWLPKAYPVTAKVPWVGSASVWGMALLLAVIGLFAGWFLAILQMKRQRGGVGPRCCMNCQFVVWEGVEGKFGCAYSAMKLRGKVVKPGKDYDTPTDCPTFQYREIARLG
ncbi:MAG: cyclic nucleotide-binding domain-containing protein [Candidatus Riflebacteria bacterium]|nr:cyclic nucleotide-binding domain-containing protein [Candidatus Riflebacteria bacterium]